MFENAAPGFVEYEISQTLVFGNPAGLFPQGCAGWWADPANDDIADFPFGMAGNHVYEFLTSHGFLNCR